MNTCSRIESSGATGRIQVSEATAELLRKGGKGHWVKPREHLVNAKGKGPMQTYWATPKDQAASTHQDSHTGEDSEIEQRRHRLIDWNVEMLSRLIKQIVARQRATKPDDIRASGQIHLNVDALVNPEQRPLDEVKEIIKLPDYDHNAATSQVSHRDIELDPVVLKELRSYVVCILPCRKKLATFSSQQFLPGSDHDFTSVLRKPFPQLRSRQPRCHVNNQAHVSYCCTRCG